jgi:hypothetical protein
MSATASCSSASSRPVRAAKVAALAAIHRMCQSKRNAPSQASVQPPIQEVEMKEATSQVQEPVQEAPRAPVASRPYYRTIKREHFFPRPAEFTTSSEFTNHLKQIQPFGRRLFENIDWWNVEAPSQWNNGAITLQGTWWLESDDMEEYSWTIEIRPSKKEYRILLSANIYSNDSNPFYRLFWSEMNEKYIPRLHEFITKMTKGLSPFL